LWYNGFRVKKGRDEQMKTSRAYQLIKYANEDKILYMVHLDGMIEYFVDASRVKFDYTPDEIKVGLIQDGHNKLFTEMFR
jgi:hypothetical protein